MPEVSRRAALGAGAGLLLGATSLPAGAQQIAAATPPKFRVQPQLQSGEDQQPVGQGDRKSSRRALCGRGESSECLERTVRSSTSPRPAATISELNARSKRLQLDDPARALFESLGEAPTRPSGVFAEALARDFGTLDRWRAEFAAIGKALDDGSGWVILTYAPRDKRLFNHWCADDAMAPAGGVPLLALDMDKHAYATDYGAEVGKYVDSFMPTIRWTTPERLYREAIRV